MLKNFISFVLTFVLFFSLHVESLPAQNDDSMVINSGEAQYDGKEITLAGQVVVQHGLGQISARHLSVRPSSAGQEKKSKFGFLKISDDVEIQLKGGGKLYCQLAQVDYAKMQGIFLGNADHPLVVYLNKGEGDVKAARAPFELKSSQMTLKLIREPATSSSSKASVEQIEADQNVRLHYNHDYLLLADHALYQRIPANPSSSIAGLLTLTVRGNLPVCKMTNLNEDLLSARMIQINTIERQLRLTEPKGILYDKQRKSVPVQTLEFSSNELIWDDREQNLLLKGNVNIHQNQSLHVHTDEELTISQAFINKQRTLRFLKAPKNIQISYLDAEKGNAHKIDCPGPFLIDHEKQEMMMQKISFSEGNQENQSRQVYVEDLMGEMYADKVHMHYTWVEHKLVPHKVVLEGHVHITNRFDGHLEESGSILHYALADRVEYFAEQREMVLSGENGERVLFFDKVNNVQMSAPSLKMRYDSTTQKSAIQGLGDVRFTFMEKELQQLKRHFPLAESSEKEPKGGKQNAE